jgi:hypothetical protein
MLAANHSDLYVNTCPGAKSSVIAVCFFAICTVLDDEHNALEALPVAEPLVHTACSAFQYQLATLHIQLNWEAPMGSDLVYSILSPEWNADKTRVDKVRYWTAVTPVPWNRFVQVGVYGGRLDLVMRIPVTTY